MKLTKKVIAAVLIAGFLATFIALPQAEAGDPHWNHGGPRYYQHHSHNHSSAAPFFGGLAFGAVTGLVVGSILAAPPVVVQPAPVVYQPAPVYVQPAPVCSSYWVNPYWNGYQWMPGYWTQACR
jgi:hypothetical protein